MWMDFWLASGCCHGLMGERGKSYFKFNKHYHKLFSIKKNLFQFEWKRNKEL